MIASLPMYDLDEVRPATDALWAALARRLRAAGVDAGDALDRAGPPERAWSDPALVFSQTCGYPLTHAFAGRLRVVAIPVYSAEGCDGPTYRSAIVVRDATSFARLEDLRGARCAINAADSHSGMNALRGVVAPFARGGRFFGDVRVTGAHAASVEAVARGDSDVAAIDAVTWALLRRYRPACVEGLRVLAWTAPAPALPFVTSVRATGARVEAVRAALDAVLADPALAEPRASLLLERAEPADERAYAEIVAVEGRAAALGYPELR